MLDLLTAITELTGPCAFTLSTWTAAHHEIEALAALHRSGIITQARFLIDFSFARRDPAAAQHIRTAFGLEAVRVAQNHSKFALFANQDWTLVLRTSMNLNMNPRFEDFTIANDPDLFAFLDRILDEIWAKQKRSMIGAKPYEIIKHFQDEL